MRRQPRFFPSVSMAGATLAAVASLGVACSSAPSTQRVAENIGATASAISTSSILANAKLWVDAKVPYCQSANGADDSIDPSCSPVCSRPGEPSAWDPYRSDCSGFVSWAWGLPAPGNTTSTFAPADTSVSYVIQGSELQPGDALNIPGDHIVLFVSWVTVGSEANFYEEPGCSATPDYAHAFTSAVTISGSDVTIAYEGSTFTAIRYTGVTGGGDAGVSPPFEAGTGDDDSGIGTPCEVNSESGECMDTSTCASMGGTSTAGLCPGADDIQCCTGMQSTSHDAGMVVTGQKDAGGAPPGTGTGTGSSPETECAAAGGTCLSVGSSCEGHQGPQSCGEGVPSGCCLPSAMTVDAGTAVILAPDGGHLNPTDAGPGGTLEMGGASGCSVSASRSGVGDGAWLFGLGGIGLFASGSRRRRRR